MAKQKGVVRLSGTVGGLNFYMLNGQPVVRAAGGGFNGKQIKRSPKMVRVRENMSEFGWCSTLNKTLRLALAPFYISHKDKTLHSRMMALLQEIKTYDLVSERGQRRVGIGMQHEIGQRLFREFAFSPKRSFMDLLGATGVYDGDALTYSVSDNGVRFPVGATHVEVLFGVLCFDFEMLEYELALAAPVIFSRSASPGAFALVLDGPPAGLGMRIGFGCVRFYLEVNGDMVVLKDLDGFGLGVLGIG